MNNTEFGHQILGIEFPFETNSANRTGSVQKAGAIQHLRGHGKQVEQLLSELNT